MALEISSELGIALDASGTPLQVVDPRTGHTYVLISEDAFARIQALIDDDLTETYPAQIESAMRAGWDDPAMDEYNNYDQHRTT